VQDNSKQWRKKELGQRSALPTECEPDESDGTWQAEPNCDSLFVAYQGGQGGNWWNGAFGNCKKFGGMTDRNQIFECAYNQVPAENKSKCLKAKLKTSQLTNNDINNVVANNRQSGKKVLSQVCA